MEDTRFNSSDHEELDEPADVNDLLGEESESEEEFKTEGQTTFLIKEELGRRAEGCEDIPKFDLSPMFDLMPLAQMLWFPQVQKSFYAVCGLLFHCRPPHRPHRRAYRSP